MSSACTPILMGGASLVLEKILQNFEFLNEAPKFCTKILHYALLCVIISSPLSSWGKPSLAVLALMMCPDCASRPL